MKKKKETCKYCGEKIEPKTTRQEFCGSKCRVYWNREKELEKLLPPQTNVGRKVVNDMVTYGVGIHKADANGTVAHVPFNSKEGQQAVNLADIQAQIDKLTAEMDAIKEGNFGTPLRNKLLDKINKLKRQLKD